VKSCFSAASPPCRTGIIARPVRPKISPNLLEKAEFGQIAGVAAVSEPVEKANRRQINKSWGSIAVPFGLFRLRPQVVWCAAQSMFPAWRMLYWHTRDRVPMVLFDRFVDEVRCLNRDFE
jgi:hypothetical protein